MIYKVGQRVRVLVGLHAGMEGVISGPACSFDWYVTLGTNKPEEVLFSPQIRVGDWPYNSAELRPIDDPRASEFIADMERFAKLAERDAARIRKIAEEKA